MFLYLGQAFAFRYHFVVPESIIFWIRVACCRSDCLLQMATDVGLATTVAVASIPIKFFFRHFDTSSQHFAHYLDFVSDGFRFVVQASVNEFLTSRIFAMSATSVGNNIAISAVLLPNCLLKFRMMISSRCDCHSRMCLRTVTLRLRRHTPEQNSPDAKREDSYFRARVLSANELITLLSQHDQESKTLAVVSTSSSRISWKMSGFSSSIFLRRCLKPRRSSSFTKIASTTLNARPNAAAFS